MKNRSKAIVAIALLMPIIIILWALYLRYIKGIPWATWTGFENKTIWDLLELFIVPIFLAIIALLFNYLRTKSENELTQKHIEDTVLSSYFDDLSNYILNNDFQNSFVRQLVRAKTFSTLQRLDGNRKGILIRFLFHLELITKENSIIDLSGADLSNANLEGNDLSENEDRKHLSYLSLFGVVLAGANLRNSSFSDARLTRANFAFADLTNANFENAHLMDVDFRSASLKGANLNNAVLLSADLSGAKGLTNKQLSKVKSLVDAKLPNGSKYQKEG